MDYFTIRQPLLFVGGDRRDKGVKRMGGGDVWTRVRGMGSTFGVLCVDGFADKHDMWWCGVGHGGGGGRGARLGWGG